MPRECIRRVKGQPWKTKVEIHEKDRMTNGLITNLSPGGEIPSILQSDGAGWSGKEC